MSRRFPQEAQVRWGRLMLLAGWIVGLGLLVAAFGGWLERAAQPALSIREGQGVSEVVLRRNAAGHYVAPGRINGERVRFLIDTGATEIALSRALAERLGLRLGPGALTRTANGTVGVWTTRLDRIELGVLHARDMPAVVLPQMPGEEVLLGMRFLRQVELVQRGDTLRLRIADAPD